MKSKWKFPTPYSLFVRLSVRREQYMQFKELAEKVAFAYQQHTQRLRWVAYATVAGPANYVYIMLPLAELGDMDTMPSLDKVLGDVYGAESQELLEKFQSCILQMESFILNRINDNIEPIETDTPPKYLYYLNMKAQPSHMGKLMKNLQQLGTAAAGNPLFCFATFAGPVRLHAFTAGATISELGELASLEGKVVQHFGAEEGHRVIDEIHDSLVDIDASVLSYIGHLD